MGSHIRLRMDRAIREIVGVVADVQQRPNVGNFGPIGAVYAAYVPATQLPGQTFAVAHTWFAPSWVVRGALPRAAMVNTMQSAIQSVDPLLPVSRVRTLDEERDKALGLQQLSATVLGTLAALALLLATVGVYGLVSNAVVQRTRELGIRIAFGASVRQALLNAAQPGIVMAGIGVLAGLGLAAATSRVLRGLLYGVQPGDSWTFAAIAGGLMLVAALASVIPAIRVVRFDPARALRDE